jgi:DNA polymerase-3 subunit beta
MKIKVPKSSLVAGLQKVSSVVGTRTTLPVLANVLLAADKKNKLSLTTTNLDVSVKCSVDVETSKEGSSTLPARRFSSIIKELPDSDIDIEIDDKNVATIKCNSSVFKIIGISDEEFPEGEKVEGKYCYRLEQSVFKEMLRKTSYAVSNDETRQVLNGVYMSFNDNKIIMVATDGRRLALVEYELEFPKEACADIILPNKTVTELLHILSDEGDIEIITADNKVMFKCDDIVLISKLIDGKYPNYKQVIPAQCEERIAIERESLLNSLKRVSLIIEDKSAATKLTFGKNKLMILTTAQDIGEAKESIPIKYSGKEISVAFNPEYMMDPLKTLENDEIFVELTDEMSPGVIKCDIPFIYVLMPMRIN